MANPELYIHRSLRGKGREPDGRISGVQRPEQEQSDHDLFRQFLLGDDDAFTLFYNRHHHYIQLYCRKMLNDAAGAKDITQEAWIRVVDMRTKPPAHLGNPVGLVVRIARNLCLDELKAPRRSRREPIEKIDHSHHTTAPLHPGGTSLEDLALLCLKRLELIYREPLILHLYCDYSFEEIAGILDLSPEATWKRASRGRKKLRKMMEKEMKDAEYE